VSDAGGALCLRCGLCCDGSLFEQVPLEAGEAVRLTAPGAKTRAVGTRAVLPQPCACLVGRRCTIYPDRPQACARFVCDMHRAYEAGELTLDACLERIEKVERFLAGARTSQVASPGHLLELAGLRRLIHEGRGLLSLPEIPSGSTQAALRS
jgi:hypothetical protein